MNKTDVSFAVNIPSKAQEECAQRISAALGIPLPEIRTRQSYWEYINKHLENSKQSKSGKQSYASYEINGAFTGYKIELSFNRMPKHCGECQLYIDSATFDEDAMFGDGIMRSCPFGADRFGCLVERPHNCPIVGRKDL